jgi:hypothetical protein
MFGFGKKKDKKKGLEEDLCSCYNGCNGCHEQNGENVSELSNDNTDADYEVGEVDPANNFKAFNVDWNKVKTIKDIKIILKSVISTFYSESLDNFPEDLVAFLIENTEDKTNE